MGAFAAINRLHVLFLLRYATQYEHALMSLGSLPFLLRYTLRSMIVTWKETLFSFPLPDGLYSDIRKRVKLG